MASKVFAVSTDYTDAGEGFSAPLAVYSTRALAEAAIARYRKALNDKFPGENRGEDSIFDFAIEEVSLDDPEALAHF